MRLAHPSTAIVSFVAQVVNAFNTGMPQRGPWRLR